MKRGISWGKACETISDVAETARTVIDNTAEDINHILGNVEDCVRCCGRAIDDTRLRIIHRQIQYYTKVIEAITRNGLVPADIIEDIYNLLEGELEGKPQHKIVHFKNPISIWDCSDPEFIEIDPETFEMPLNKEAWVFIHGLRYKAMNRDGSDFEIDKFKKDNAYEFYKFFEEEAKMFDPKGIDYENVNVYFVSYDSEMSDEDEEKIKVVLEALGIGGPQFHLILAAIFWREIEKRAKATGNYIMPFLNKLSKKNKGRAVTHSLGCYVMAHAAQQMNPTAPSFQSWWCMNAALPSDAFTNTGDFQRAPRIAGVWDPDRDPNREPDTPPTVIIGTTVWYSVSDLVLMLLYPLANFHPAIGQTGIGIVAQSAEMWVSDVDVTLATGINHRAEDYFKPLGPSIRALLNTLDNPSDICPSKE
ncbi:hypothetical protein SAMN04487776_11837 [Priestia megaterium]|nr:hypothetical protein SAMN04487776_11837 [Priestia megaterium]